MWDWLKWKICGHELHQLRRYRIAVHEADRWLASMPPVPAVLAWICAYAADLPHTSMIEFRESLRRRQADLIEAAVVAEREECARACEIRARSFDGVHALTAHEADQCAHLIRSRGAGGQLRH